MPGPTEPVEVAPGDQRVRALIAAHLEAMRASSPASSVHAMQPGDLEAAGARFFAVLEADRALAIGALKPLSRHHGEVKSMHVVKDRRGSGLADAILARILDAARAAGMTRVSLETGSQAAFAPARAFYGRHGFSSCAAYEGYVPDPNSFYMTMAL